MTKSREKANKIKLAIFDLDGVMTDGKLYFSNKGDEMKAFYTPDGVGIKLLHSAGIKTAIITGRESEIAKRRATELGIDHLIQNRDDKLEATTELCQSLNFDLDEVAYTGDDLPDYAAIKSVGLGIAVQNASRELAKIADYQTKACGGSGAVREACEYILESQNRFGEALSKFSIT